LLAIAFLLAAVGPLLILVYIAGNFGAIVVHDGLRAAV
jgi:hypothetical protein